MKDLALTKVWRVQGGGGGGSTLGRSGGGSRRRGFFVWFCVKEGA